MTTGNEIAEAGAAALAAPALVGIQRLTAIDTVRARIGMAVELGLLKPNERLPGTPEIASALDVSEITVRRAMESLCEDGVLIRLRGRTGGTLVSARPRHGAVTEIAAYQASTEHVHRLIDQRLVFDCGLAALAATRVSKRALIELRKHIRAMDRAESWAPFHTADERFHRAVAKATRLPGADAAYEPVLHELYRYYLPYPIEYLRSSNEEHRLLVDALEAGNTDEAVNVARRHVETLHKTMFVGLFDVTGRAARS
jgi:DNA-binding FadR family transcriptional regulator